MKSIDPRIPTGVGSKKHRFSVPSPLIKHRPVGSKKVARALTALLLACVAVCGTSSQFISAHAQTSSMVDPLRSEQTGVGSDGLESKISSDLHQFVRLCLR